MKYLGVIALVVFFGLSSLFAQTPDIIWESSYDYNEQTDRAYGAARDSQGNIIVVGTTRDSTYFVEFLTVKFDSAGNYIWHKIWSSGADSGSGAWSVACDNLDNIIVVGWDIQNILSDYHIVKYDQDGNELWTQHYDSGSRDLADYVAIDQDNNIFVHGTVDVEVNADWYTIKYDSAGVEQWSVLWDGGDYDYGSGIATYKDSLFATTGKSCDSAVITIGLSCGDQLAINS